MVFYQDNNPITDFSLRLSPAGRHREPRFADVSPADGYFFVNGPTPETYFLSVSPPNADGWFTRFELLESTSVKIVVDLSDSGSGLQIRKSW